MTAQPHLNSPNLVVVIGFAIFAWYLYQVGSRKKELLRFRAKRALLSIAVYLATVALLIKQGLPPLEAVVLGLLVGMGAGWLLLTPPKDTRRIPTAVRRAVIARDLTSKGLKWDPMKYHIDHIVPFSRGGDNSMRNLRVVEKRRNLRKGSTMPGLVDFLRK